MRILSADPGYDRLGVAVIEKGSGKEELVHSDCVLTNNKDDLKERLLDMGEKFEALIHEFEPEGVAIETLYFNLNQKTAIAVAESRGILLYLAAKHKLPVFEYTPQQIKVAVTGYGKSTKKQVAEMVERLVSVEKKIQYDDEYDAIAVGLTALASIPNNYSHRG